MQSDDSDLPTEMWAPQVPVAGVTFAPRPGDRGRRPLADNVTGRLQTIRILGDIFTTELSAKGESNSTSGQFEQIGSINVKIEFRQLGAVDVLRMNRGEGHW